MNSANTNIELSAPAAEGMSLSEYLYILRRRRSIILRTFLIITAVGVAISLLAKPVYQGSAWLLVEDTSSTVRNVDTSDPLSQLFSVGQTEPADTQVEAIQTPQLLDKVTSKYDLDDKAINVSVVKDDEAATNLIEVDVNASKPKVAADAANELANDYLTQQEQLDGAEVQKATDFVTAGGQSARRTLILTELALASYTKKHQIADLERSRNDATDRLTALKQSYNSDQSELASALSQLDTNRALLAKEPASVMVPMRATNDAVRSLNEDLGKLIVQRQGMVQPGGYNANAPQIRAIDGQIAALKLQIRQTPKLTTTTVSEADASRDALRTQVLTLQAQAAGLKRQVEVIGPQITDVENELRGYIDDAVQLGELERRRDAALADDKNFSDKLSQLSIRAKAHHAAAQMYAPAETPETPIAPKRAANIILAAVIGLVLGVCFAFVQEFMDNKLVTVEDADRFLSLPVLGYLPLMTDAQIKQVATDKYSLDREDFRTLLTNIHFAGLDEPVRTLLVTSVDSVAGKTMTAIQLATLAAQEGRKVVVVDTDLRKPMIHVRMQVPSVPGVTDVLRGSASLEDTLMIDEELPNLNVLTCGSMPPNAATLLGTRTFSALLTRLRSEFDLVILDSPPLEAAVDAQILASQVDGVLLVVQIGHTGKIETKQAMATLRQARAKILGVAYNRVEGRRRKYYLSAPSDESSASGANGDGSDDGSPRGQIVLRSSNGKPVPLPEAGDALKKGN